MGVEDVDVKETSTMGQRGHEIRKKNRRINETLMCKMKSRAKLIGDFK